MVVIVVEIEVVVAENVVVVVVDVVVVVVVVVVLVVADVVIVLVVVVVVVVVVFVVDVVIVLVIVIAGASQQSREGSPAVQLSAPHTRSPAQWLSRSQSPSPTPQGEAAVQQEKLLLDGSHVPVTVVGASGCVVMVKIFGNVTETTWIVGSTVTAVTVVSLLVPRVFAVTEGNVENSSVV